MSTKITASARRAELANLGITDKDTVDRILADQIMKGTIVDNEGLSTDLNTDQLSKAVIRLEKVISSEVRKGAADAYMLQDDPYIDGDSAQLVSDIATAISARLMKGGSAPTEFGIALGEAVKAQSAMLIGLAENSNATMHSFEELMNRVDRIEKGLSGGADRGQSMDLATANRDLEVIDPTGGAGGASYDMDDIASWAEKKITKGGSDPDDVERLTHVIQGAEAGLIIDGGDARPVTQADVIALAKSLGYGK